MKKILPVSMFLIFVTIFLNACTRIETGEVGLRRTFSGTIEPTELGVGFHQTIIGEVIVFATKEILLSEENLTQASKDKSTLKDFDINFTYIADPKAASDLYTKYSTTSHMKNPNGTEIFPMGSFVTTIVRAASYSAVAEYDALEVNNNRKQIEDRIKAMANEKLSGEGLAGKVSVNMVNIRNIELAKEIVDSANRVSQAKNDLNAKTTEVDIAKQEAKRIEELNKQTGPQYVELLKAQAMMKNAEALKAAAEKGSTIWVVPQNFTALGNR